MILFLIFILIEVLLIYYTMFQVYYNTLCMNENSVNLIYKYFVSICPVLNNALHVLDVKIHLILTESLWGIDYILVHIFTGEEN